MNACCFTGHRTVVPGESVRLLSDLDEAIITAIERGVTVFRNGGALGFDTLAARAVLNLRASYPDIKLCIDIPHTGQELRWSDYNQQVYRNILSLADEVTYVSESYYPSCMHKRNRYMVDRSDMVIAYVRKTKGGSYYTVNYAEQMGKEVIYL